MADDFACKTIDPMKPSRPEIDAILSGGLLLRHLSISL